MKGCLMMVGLARKAGCLILGEDSIRTAVSEHKAKAIFAAADATPNTVKKAKRFAETGKIPFVEVPFTKEEFGAAVGVGEIAAAAVTNPEIACGITEKLRASDPEKYGEAADFLQQRAKAQRERKKGAAKGRTVKRKENA
jgi:ribosomal protein L7Ae-like RNA K-turn-binding protein